MQRLLKRRKVQECLEETEKEMGDSGMSLNDLESLLNEEGIDTKMDTLPTRRIVSNVSTRFLLIKDVKQALAEAKKRKELEIKAISSIVKENTEEENKPTTSKVKEITVSKEEITTEVDELEDDLQKAIKMSLECVDETNTSVTAKTDDSWTSCMTDTDGSNTDSEEDDGFEQPDLTCAKSYIMQYSDFTHKAIDKIITDRKKNKNKQKIPKVDEILEEINKEKSVIVDNVELSSSEEECMHVEAASDSSEGNNQIAAEYNPSSVYDETSHKIYLDSTQASVVCVENSVQEIISLDSSTEETDNVCEKAISRIKQETDSSEELLEVTNAETNDETDSSDNEFEEVPEVETKPNKPVVELTLNMGEAPDDDIFADIFEEKKEPTNDKKIAIKDFKTEHKETRVKAASEDIPVVFKIPEVPVLKNNIEIPVAKDKKHESLIDRDPAQPTTLNIVHVENEMGTTDLHNENSNKMDIDRNLPVDIVEDSKQNNSELSRDLVKATNITNNPPKQILTTEKLNSLVEEMQNEEQNLMQEKGRLDRIGRNITEQMTKEAQELLQIFGIPYIVAPMEAEAQCAFLESVNLTDGTITDDSDIWLFGGRTVYKNFFNQKKHVLQFLAERIERSFSKYLVFIYTYSHWVELRNKVVLFP